MSTKQMIEWSDTIQIFQDGSPAPKLRYLFFLPIRLNDPGLYSLVLNLLATTKADQVVCSPPCRRYVVRANTQAMEQEHGVLVSVVLPDTRESELAIQGWAIQAAKQLGVNEVRLVSHEIQTIDIPANHNFGFQLTFDW